MRSFARVGRRIGAAGAAAAALPSFAQTMTQARGAMVSPTGRTYKPSGYQSLSENLPINAETAETFNQLAKSAHATRNLKDAASMYEKVLQFRRREYGHVQESCAATLHNLARVYIDMKNHQFAMEALQEACAIYEELKGSDNLQFADSLSLLALTHRNLGEHDQAEGYFKECVKIYRKLCYNFEDNSWIPSDGKVPEQPNLSPLASVAHVLSDCAVLFVYREQPDNAAEFLEESLAIRRFLYTNNSKFKPIIAQSLTKLAEVKRTQMQFDEALNLCEEALKICEDTMGREAPATASVVSSKGNALVGMRKFREAKRCHEEAATTFGLAFGKMSPLVATEMLQIGRISEFLMEFEAAEKAYEKCIDITTETVGKDHPQVADAKSYLGGLRVKFSNFDDGIALLRDALRIRKLANPNDAQLPFDNTKLANALGSKGDADAEGYFLEAIELYRRRGTKNDDLLMTDVLDDLGLHYANFKIFDKAAEAFEEAFLIRRRELGDSHPALAYCHSNNAYLAMAMEKWDEGIKEGDRAVELYQAAKTGGSDVTLATADVFATTGHCYAGKKEYRKAMSFHEKSLDVRRTQGDPAALLIADSLIAMADVQLAQGPEGDLKKAATFLAEAERQSDIHPRMAARVKNRIAEVRRKFPGLPPSAK